MTNLISSLPLTGNNGAPIGIRCVGAELRSEGESSIDMFNAVGCMERVLVEGEKRSGEPTIMAVF